MKGNTALFWGFAILVVGIAGCGAFETYCIEKTRQEYIKNGYVEREIGTTFWNTHREWVKEKE